MQPGTFAELTPMNGWNNGGILNPLDVSGCMPSDYITQYSDKAGWDPINQRILYLGQTHGECYAGRFVSYDVGTNSWAELPWPSYICQSGTQSSPCFDHAYDNNAVDPATGDFYYRNYNSLTFLHFHNGSWTKLSQPATQNFQCCSALEFFPEMNRLLFLDGDWGLWAYNPSNGSWAALANTNGANAVAGLPNLPMSSTAVFAHYDPVLKIVLFGGGTHLYKLNSSGVITTLKTPPAALGPTNAVVASDPVGGKFIVLAGSAMYQYDASTDTWTQLAISVPTVLSGLDGVGDGLVSADIPLYGVIMYIKYDNASSKVYLYKHSPSPPVLPFPDAPTNVSVQ